MTMKVIVRKVTQLFIALLAMMGRGLKDLRSGPLYVVASSGFHKGSKFKGHCHPKAKMERSFPRMHCTGQKHSFCYLQSSY